MSPSCRAVTLLAVALLIGESTNANATNIALDFSLTPVEYQGQGGDTAISGLGTVVLDSSLLGPNVLVFFGSTDEHLRFLSFFLTGIPGSPSSTRFDFADFDKFIFQTDSTGTIIDMNFFWGAPPNADGYSINGLPPVPFLMEFCSGGAGDVGCARDDARIEFLSITDIVIQQPGPVPEPATISLLGLGLVGVGARRWRRRKTQARHHLRS